MLTVTKIFHFCYGHFLPDYDGKCRTMHGHNSRVEVEFSAKGMPEDRYSGMVVDFKHIKDIVRPIIDSLDHKCLNTLNSFVTANPTAENITLWLRDEIRQTSLSEGLVRVRVSETDDSFAEWRADQ